METKLLWWGYIHVNGSIQVKRFLDSRDIQEAAESPFVERFSFKAGSRDEDIEYIKQK